MASTNTNPVVLRGRKSNFPSIRGTRNFGSSPSKSCDLNLSSSSGFDDASTKQTSMFSKWWNEMKMSFISIVQFTIFLFSWNSQVEEFEHKSTKDFCDSKENFVDGINLQNSPNIVKQRQVQDKERDEFEVSDESLIVLSNSKPEKEFQSFLGTLSLITDPPKSNQFQNKSKYTQYGTSLGNSNLDEPKQLASNPFEINSSSVNEEFSLIDNDYNIEVAKFYIPRAPRMHLSVVDTLLNRLKTKPFVIDQRQEEIRKEREKSQSLVQPLSSDQLAKVNKIWNASNQSMIISSKFQIDITVRDLQTLCDGQWLNDNIIDFYLNMISSDDIFCWTTHFFSTLQAKGYSGVARWAKRRKIDVTKKKLIITPINIMGTHWALAVINNTKKRFEYYDSLSSRGNKQALLILQDYMKQEGKKQNSSIDFETYSLESLMKTPQQENGYDCGVFTCTLAYFVSKQMPLKFSQKDMKLLRRKMAYEILTKEIMKP